MERLGVLLLSLDGMVVHHREPSMMRLVLPPGWDASPSQGTQYEEVKGIITLSVWDASPHRVTPSICSPVHIYTLVR